MTIDQSAGKVPTDPEAIESGLLGFLGAKTNTTVAADHDLFASGLVSSMFAMELVVHIERTYAVAIVGGDLKLDNFRTVEKMTALVLRLQESAAEDRGV